MKKLSFYAPADRRELITDHEALKGGVVRYIGRRWDLASSAFVPTGQAQTVSAMFEYVQAARRGELIPANAETAKHCGLPFEAKK
jgi:hypothetical protein